MYMKLQIFTQIGTLKILEQKDTPPRETLTKCDDITIKSICGPDICLRTIHDIVFYIRGSDHSRDFTVLNYLGEKTLNRILKALSTIASVDVIWS